MIRLLKKGQYTLMETKGESKILVLDGMKTYAWIYATDIGEILITSHNAHKVDHILSIGKYRLYDIKDEPKFADLLHLELFVGEGRWQGYLLPTGLPNDKKRRSRIIPTNETVTTTTLNPPHLTHSQANVNLL